MVIETGSFETAKTCSESLRKKKSGTEPDRYQKKRCALPLIA